MGDKGIRCHHSCVVFVCLLSSDCMGVPLFYMEHWFASPDMISHEAKERQLSRGCTAQDILDLVLCLHPLPLPPSSSTVHAS